MFAEKGFKRGWADSIKLMGTEMWEFYCNTPLAKIRIRAHRYSKVIAGHMD